MHLIGYFITICILYIGKNMELPTGGYSTSGATAPLNVYGADEINLLNPCLTNNYHDSIGSIPENNHKPDRAPVQIPHNIDFHN